MKGEPQQERILKCVPYTLRLLLGEEFWLQHSIPKILYQKPKTDASDDAVLYIVPCALFGDQYGTLASLPTLPLEEINSVPLLFGSPTVERKGNRLVVHADIIASTYFLVTRYEEVVRRGVRDEHGCFPGKESLPYRAGFIDRPIVEEYAALLRKWLQEVGVDIPKPKGKFSVLLTHDVDSICKYRRILQPLWTTAGVLLRQRSLWDILESFVVRLHLKRDPFYTFEEMIKLDTSVQERAYSIPTDVVYFFMAGGKSRFDGMYNIRSKAARDVIKMVCQSGATIGLHTSYEAGAHRELIAKEKVTLEQVCGFPIRRNRHHYLGWREIEDGWALEEAGIDWDATLGYSDVAGFRLGVCHPIQLFDPIKLQAFGIEEHPLTIMDKSLTISQHMGLNEEEAFEYSKRLLDQTKKYNGELVLLWHNDAFSNAPEDYRARLYSKLLRFAV